MLTVEWFRFCVYVSRQADIGSGNIDLLKPFQMFHFSEITTHLSRTLEAETEKHSTSSEMQSSYIVLLANADAVISNKNTAEKSYCNLWIPWLSQIAPGMQLTLTQFFVFRALNNTFRITPSFCGASFSLLFWQTEKFRQQYYKCLTHIMGKGLEKGFLVPKLY